MREEIQDLTIIGGGVMGLCTAYYASYFTPRITVLEKSTIGNKKTASFSYTRSIRNDYLDPLYARLAYEARKLWLEIESKSTEPFIINCGCLNIAKKSVSPDLSATYAEQSYATLRGLHLKTETFTRSTLQQRFPQFDADIGRLDVEAGFLYVPPITRTLLESLQQNAVSIREDVEVIAIQQRETGRTIEKRSAEPRQLANDAGASTATQSGKLQGVRSAPLGPYIVSTSVGEFITKALVVTAGLGTNEILRCIEGCYIDFPLRPDRPSQCKYFIPPAEKRAMFTAEMLPVFAYLDVGIYGHPIYAEKTPGVKIGFYNPPDVKAINGKSGGLLSPIRDVHSFVNECMPSLRDADAVDVTEVDQCFYDLVADDNFILGNLPGFSNIYVGVGWRGTGYKYAPWVGQVLMQLALQEGTVYDISRFSPQRFVSHGF